MQETPGFKAYTFLKVILNGSLMNFSVQTIQFNSIQNYCIDRNTCKQKDQTTVKTI